MRIRKRRKPWKGEVHIADNSGLRKRMRAARRGLLPVDILRKIEDASSEKALMRHRWYQRAFDRTIAAPLSWRPRARREMSGAS